MADNLTPALGHKMPQFQARTTNGLITFPDEFYGKWVILYSYIGDFLPSDTTDILALNDAKPKFTAHGAEILAMSPDSVATHIAWLLSLRNQRMGNANTNVDIELISDRSLEIADMFDINTTDNNMNYNEKTVYIIDDEGILRSKHTYSQNTGINVTDIERELLALQTAKYQFGQTPSGWTPGEDVLDHPPQTITSAGSNIQVKESIGGQCLDWYICFRPDNGTRRA